MRDQPEWLINNPKFSDLETMAHQILATQDFQPLNAKAERLEISAQTQDWTIPQPGVPLIPAPAKGKPELFVQEDPPLAEDIQEPKETPTTEKPSFEKPKPKNPRVGNTPLPKGGVLIGPSPTPPIDPWTPTPQGTPVLPGAKIVLK